MMRRDSKKLVFIGTLSIMVPLVYIFSLNVSTTENAATQHHLETPPSTAQTMLSHKDPPPTAAERSRSMTEDQVGWQLQERRARVQMLCSKKVTVDSQDFLTRLHLRVFRRLYIDNEHKITWCPTYKAASSTFMWIFASLGHVLTPKTEQEMKEGKLQINYLTRRAFPMIKSADVRKIVSSTRRLIVVRHPFERLLSAYRDKLEHREEREFYYEHYGRKIVRLYGETNASREPTFTEFLQYVAGRHPPDEHWQPYYVFCAPCEFDYHFILKTENLNREQEYLAHALQREEFLPSEGGVNANPSGLTNFNVTHSYYSAIPRDLLQMVYQIYYKDFELFNYSADDYFKMTQQ